MSRILIGVTGTARHGKDTVADHLVSHMAFTKASFATAVKEFAINQFGLTREECYREKTEKSRWILQSIGNGCREEFGDEIWIEKLSQQIGALERTVISDVRYLNEAEYIRKMGGYIIRVERPDAPAIECGADHPSEMEMGSIVPNFSLHNDGSLAQLYSRLDGIYSCITDRGARCSNQG